MRRYTGRYLYIEKRVYPLVRTCLQLKPPSERARYTFCGSIRGHAPAAFPHSYAGIAGVLKKSSIRVAMGETRTGRYVQM